MTLPVVPPTVPFEFVDTDVLIDIERGHPLGVLWYQSMQNQLAISGWVAMEMIDGAQNKQDLNNRLRLVAQLPKVWCDEAIHQAAYALLARHRLKDGLRIADTLIAATALSESGILYTFNQKHFSAITGLTAIAPYLR